MEDTASTNKKAVIAAIFLLFIIISGNKIFLRYFSDKTVVPSQSPAAQDNLPYIAHSGVELCSNLPFRSPQEGELQFNKNAKADPYVTYLRITLDNWLSGKYSPENTSDSCMHPGLYNGKQCPDTAVVDLEAIGRDYISGKFIVLWFGSGAEGGGTDGAIVFKDRPDKVFSFWIYDYKYDAGEAKGYDLRSLKERPEGLPGVKTIDQVQSAYANQFCDPSFGL